MTATGYLTTHVLDTARGLPATGMAVTLWRLDGPEGRRRIVGTHTNADGRTDAHILPAGQFAPGVYELEFAVGAYYAAQGIAGETPRFLDIVPIRFGIADPSAHYHVPLLVSPYAFSTYRGS